LFKCCLWSVKGVFKKRPNYSNSAPTSTESALRLLSAPSVRFWQQTSIPNEAIIQIVLNCLNVVCGVGRHWPAISSITSTIKHTRNYTSAILLCLHWKTTFTSSLPSAGNLVLMTSNPQCARIQGVSLQEISVLIHTVQLWQCSIPIQGYSQMCNTEAAIHLPDTVPAGIPVDTHAQYFVANDLFLLTILQAFANCYRSLHATECFFMFSVCVQ
jgi:hypothetical protein